MGIQEPFEQPSIEIPSQPYRPQQQTHHHYPHPPLPQYSPQAPLTAAVAPGGYQVCSPQSPLDHLPTPFIDVQRSSSCGNSSCWKKQSQGKCGQQQQQQQQLAVHYQPDHVVCIGQPVKQQQQQQHDGCCGVGWVLYGIGWIFPLCWVVAILLPCATKERADKRAAFAAAVTLGVLVAIIAAVVMAMMIIRV